MPDIRQSHDARKTEACILQGRQQLTHSDSSVGDLKKKVEGVPVERS